MELLVIIAIAWLLISRIGKSKTPAQTGGSDTSHNRQWVDFIAGYLPLTKTKGEKELLRRMVHDAANQGVVSQEYANQSLGEASTEYSSTTTAPAMAAVHREPRNQPQPAVSRSTEKSRRLDNTSLLLYFGAFLFVASAGLFVTLAGTSGVLRTLIVAVVAGILYVLGVWLFQNKPALKPAGLAFAGMGIAIAPLVGVAAYNYVFPDSPQAVWLATSVLCLALYIHAVLTLRRPLMNYVFMFTLLSLFESSMAIMNLPIYYFGWMMAAVALGLQVLSMKGSGILGFAESSRTSSQLFLPLAVLVSVVVVAEQGAGQLGVSLLLASMFYALEAIRPQAAERLANVTISQISAIVSAASLTYAATHNHLTVGYVLLALGSLQVVLLTSQAISPLVYNAASVAMISTLVGLSLLYELPTTFLLGLGVSVIISALLWWRQQRTDAYGLMTVGWIIFPVILGQRVFLPPSTSLHQALLCLTGLVVHVALFVLVVLPARRNGLLSTARGLLGIQIVVSIVAALFVSSGLSLLLISTTGILILELSHRDNADYWAPLSGVVVALSVLRCWSDTLLPLALCISLAYSILLSIRFRSEPNRWLSTLLWLLLPVGLGGLTTTNSWTNTQYAWCYVAIMLGLVVSRSIARGVVFVSSTVSVASYSAAASWSYLFGYIAAAALAVGISFAAANSQLQTTAILVVLSVVALFVSVAVERRPKLLAIQPVLWQAIVFSGLRPELVSGPQLAWTLFVSTALAALFYVLARWLSRADEPKQFSSQELVEFSLLSSAVAPSLAFFAPLVWAMPVGLFVAGLLLCEYQWRQEQSSREASIAVVVTSIMWGLYYLGFREFQAYTHIIALTFAGFAWWRHAQNDRQASDNYLYWMLGVATIPLALQAVSGAAGGLYGWWLLLEQVMFMLIGMTTRRHVVTMWGLYVAVGSVLYQLRNLGYAALALLGAFVIGIALYQLQKANKQD